MRQSKVALGKGVLGSWLPLPRWVGRRPLAGFAASAVLLAGGMGLFPGRSLAQSVRPYTPNLSPPSLQQDGLALFEEAGQLAQLGRYDLALPRAKIAAQLLPDDVRLMRLLGGLLLQQGELEQAVVVLDRARKAGEGDDANTVVLFALGSAYGQQRRYDLAIPILTEALKAEPEEVTGRFDLGNAYWMTGQLDDALEQYKRILEKDAKFWPAVNNIGLVRYEQGDIEQAIAQWKQALSLNDGGVAEPELAIAVANYRRYDCAAGQNRSSALCRNSIAQGRTAINREPAYSTVEHMQLNLWGKTLIQDAKAFFDDVQIRSLIDEINGPALPASAP
ncbi:MAG: tetratricopeptide repeat protein [Cyanobacteria bacterium P01_D01_bin.73]